MLSTRPAKVRRPKVTCVTNDSVTLRWQFTPLFLKVLTHIHAPFQRIIIIIIIIISLTHPAFT